MMDAKEMMRRLRLEENELSTHLDALKQVPPTEVVFNANEPLSALSMLEANMNANWQTVGGTLNALVKSEQSLRHTIVQPDSRNEPNERESEIIDVTARVISVGGTKIS
jgi:hypothetical protein